jgi:hypothetical protein
MATIAIQDGKVVLKDGKVSCTCCGGLPCSGCKSVAENTGLTTIAISGKVVSSSGFEFLIPAQSVSTVEPYSFIEYSGEGFSGLAVSELCGASNLTEYIFFDGVLIETVGVSFGITKKDGECVVELGAFDGLRGPADYTQGGSGGITIPLSNLIGTHSFTFPVTGCFYPPEGPAECNTVDYNAEITIS